MKVNQKVVLPANMTQVQSPQTQRISMYLQENERRGAECIDQYMSTEDSRALTNRYIKRQKVYRPRQKHSGAFLLPRVRFKKLRSSLNLSSLYLEMRLFFKRPWDRYQGILKRKSSKKFKMWAGIQGPSTGVYRPYMRSEDPLNDEPTA